MEVELQGFDDFACLLGQTVLLDERHHGQLHGSQGGGQLQHHAGFAVLELLFLVGSTHHAEEHAVHADGGFDDIRCIAFVRLGIEVLDVLAGELLVLREVEVGAAVDTFHFLEAEGHQELDVGSGVGIVGQLLVVVEAVVVVAEAQGLVPLQAGFLPGLEPLQLGAGLHEKLHLHLLELTHAEDELTGHDFVAEGLTYLCDTEGDLHTARLLHVQVVDEDTLRRLGAEVHLHGTFGRGTHLGGEHQVELTYLGPVLRAADGADDFLVKDDLAQLVQIRTGIHGLGIAFVQGVALGLVLQHAGVGRAELGFIEGVAILLGSLGHFLVDFLVVLGYLVLDEHVGAVALLRVAVVDEGVVEGIHMSAGLPDGGVHEDGRVDAHDVLVEQHHALPPVLLDVVLQFHAVLTVVVHSSQSVIDFAAGEYEAVLLAMRNDFLKNVFLCHFLQI